MKEYLRPYLLPKEMGGKEYICTLCKNTFVVRKDSASGNRQTFSICRSCKTKLGRIETYGSLENFKKLSHENLSKACKEKWKNEDYKNHISEKVKETWKKEGYREKVSKSVENNWKNLSEEAFEKRRENIKINMKNFFLEKENNIKNFKKDLQTKYGCKFYTLAEAVEFIDCWDGFIEQTAKKLNILPLNAFQCTFYSEPQLQEIAKKKCDMGCSLEEKELLDFIKSVYKEEIIENDRKLLNGKELDIYIPGKKLAIEFNGIYWHSDLINLKKGEIPSKEKKKIAQYRHVEKTKACEEKGIRLIHVFEDDWIFQKEKVESLLKNILCPDSIKTIFARKCEIKNLDSKTYKSFLKSYHLQNYSAADIKLGLFYQEELVECIGIKIKGTHSRETELVRLCTKAGYRVIGGFSKLLKHAEVDNVVSYIDRATFNGEGYFKIGFKKELENNPTYFYAKNYMRYPRYKFMRKLIQEKYNKGVLEYWNPEETEEVNMYKNGYGRIWNCGTIKVRWSKN